MGVPAPSGVSASGVSPYPTDQANGVLQGTLSAIGVSPPFAVWGPMNLFLWASVTTTLTTTAASLSATVGAAGTIAAGEAINSVNVPPGTTVGTLVGTTVTMLMPTLTYYANSLSGSNKLTGLSSTAGLVGSTVTGLGVPAATTVTAINTPAVPAANVLGTVTLSNNVTINPQDTQPTPFTFKLTASAITVTGADAAASFTGGDIVYTGSAQLERSFDGGRTWLPCNIGGGGQMAQWSAGTPVSISFGEPERQILYRVNATALTGGNINYRISATGQAATVLSVPAL